jgi:trehalose-phosphatase
VTENGSPDIPEFDGDLAWFLDIDGSLLEIAESPELVQVSTDLRGLLRELGLNSNGAVAMVSGRSIASIDALFAPDRYCTAGQHGLERRNAQGEYFRPLIDAPSAARIRAELRAFSGKHPGSLIEDKGLAFALHFRGAPAVEHDARAMMRTLRDSLQYWHLQEGKRVIEIKPEGASKRTAVMDFMREAPFASRRPVFIGDDLTDEDAFTAVNELNGISIRVGDGETVAHHRVASVAAVHSLLARQNAAVRRSQRSVS